MKTAYRIEKDSLGPRKVPAGAYWGAQTSRALENFPISGLTPHRRFVDAFLYLKKAAALANLEAKALEERRARAIVKACDEILGGKLRDQFVVDVFQTGAGTGFHMNVNEVLANRAGELLGGKLGRYDRVHPNDHVNMGQSTNDVFPTAMRLAGLLLIRQRLEKPLDHLAGAFSKKAKQFDQVLKSARTHLQDAVPIRLGQEFAAWAMSVRRHREAIGAAANRMCELGIGGSAAGTGLNTARGYRERILKHLCKLTGLPLRPAPDLREAMQSQRPVAEVSAALRNFAVDLGRICNDLRLLSSGPTTGLAEIHLPDTAPGSSIMPGKVNPSIPEMVNMVCFQVFGCDQTIAMAGHAGQLELNVMMPVMAFNLNFMIEILGNAAVQLRSRCVEGITANAAVCRRYAERSLGLATALNPHIGYAHAAEVTKIALKQGKTILQVIREKRILTDAQIKRIMDPLRMTEPH